MYVAQRGRLAGTVATRTTKAEQGEASRATLVRAARALFTERGYGGVGTEEIVRSAKLTRGALYHHFTDKKDLFRAVHEQIEDEVMTAIGSRMAESASDPVEFLAIGTRAYLDVCTDPAITRVTLVDAPSVLGWEEWREIDLRHGLGLVMAGLEGGMEAGLLRRQPVRPLAHLLLGAMGEAGMMIANADDPAAARAEIEPALLGVLDGLRA
jgi:AcrR family transcriptional regulator